MNVTDSPTSLEIHSLHLRDIIAYCRTRSPALSLGTDDGRDIAAGEEARTAQITCLRISLFPSKLQATHRPKLGRAGKNLYIESISLSISQSNQRDTCAGLTTRK